jgi:phage-related protein
MWGILVLIGQAIITAFTVAAEAVAAALLYVITAIAGAVVSFATAVYAGLWAIGQAIGTSLFYLIDFIDSTIVPVVTKVYDWITRAYGWLKKFIKPYVDALNTIRKHLMDVWKNWLRPVLDIIDVGRAFLRILSTVGLKFAQTLDAELARIEDKIERPFRYVLARLSDVENVINRIVTLDGLIQRLALIKSLEKNAAAAFSTLVAGISHGVSDETRAAAAERLEPKTRDQVEADARQYLTQGDGPNRALWDELVQQGRILFR